MSAVAAPCYHCEVAFLPKHALLALAVENERMPEIVFGESFDRS